MQRQEHVYQTGNDAYHLLTEYLTEQEKQTLQQKLDALKFTDEENISFVQQVQQGLWKEIFTSKDKAVFPTRILKCLHDGHITTMQYVTGQIFYNVFTSPRNKSAKIENLFNQEGELIASSRNKVEATMKVFSSSFKAYLDLAKASAKQPVTDGLLATVDINMIEEASKQGFVDWVNDEERDRFYKLLSEMPASERCFILMDDPYFNGVKISPETSVWQQINYKHGFNIFSRFRINGKPMCMIPSAGMMEAYLQATRAESRVPAVYRFGLSPVDGLYATKKTGRRDKIICTPLLPHKTPATADSLPAHVDRAEPESHDFYHEAVCNNLPLGDNKLFDKLIDKIREIGQQIPVASRYTEIVVDRFIEVEFRSYDRNIEKCRFLKIFAYMKKVPPQARFWSAVDLTDVCSCYLLLSTAGVTSVQALESVKKAYDEGRKIVAEELAKWLIENDKQFAECFNISIEELKNFPAFDNFLVSQMQKHIQAAMKLQMKPAIDGFFARVKNESTLTLNAIKDTLPPSVVIKKN